MCSVPYSLVDIRLFAARFVGATTLFAYTKILTPTPKLGGRTTRIMPKFHGNVGRNIVSKPISPEEHNYPYSHGYENEFSGNDLKFLYDDTWDFGFTEYIESSGYRRSRVVSINDPSVKKKYVGLKEVTRYNDYGFAYSTWTIEVSLKTSHENSELNIIDSYKIFEISNRENPNEKYLLLMRKYLTGPNEGTTPGYGGFNNDYIILKPIK